MSHRGAHAALELPPALRGRAAKVPGAEQLVLEAFELGCAAGSGRLADELLGYATERLVEAERLYGEPLPHGRDAALGRSYQSGAHPPVIEAHFSAVGAVLYALHAEIRRLHPRKGS